VGRTAVREGLRILEQSGLISVKQGREGGSFINNVNMSIVSNSLSDVIKRSHIELDHLTEVRIGIEKLIIEVAIPRIMETELVLLKKHIDDASAMLEEAVQYGKPFDFNLWVESNSQFHLVLARATRNPLYEMILESLCGKNGIKKVEVYEGSGFFRIEKIIRLIIINRFKRRENLG